MKILDFDDETILGNVYGISKRLSFSSEGTLDFVIDSRSFNKSNFILKPFIIGATGAGPIIVDLYKDTVYTAGTGTVVSSVRRDTRGIAVAGKTFGILAPTITSVGVKFPTEYLIMSGSSPGLVKIAGETGVNLPIPLDFGVNYLIRMTNTAANTGIGSISIDWLEK